MIEGISLIFEMISAIGTVGAVIVALWLAACEWQPKLDCVFIWATATQCKPVLIINNIGRKLVIIEMVRVIYGGCELCLFDVLRDPDLYRSAIVRPNTETQIILNTDRFRLQDADTKNRDEKHELEVIVNTTDGKQYSSRCNYTYNELMELFFGDGLFN